MIAFIEKLNSEVLRSIERIESRDTDVLKKSLEASRVLGEAFDRLKQYIIGYRFQNDDEEIKFFKEIKTNLKFGPVSEKGMKRGLQGICPGIMLISSL